MTIVVHVYEDGKKFPRLRVAPMPMREKGESPSVRLQNYALERVADMMAAFALHAKLTEEAAWKCVRSAALEKGTAMYAYKCKWCGNYHLTSHPLPGVEYPIKAEPIKVSM